MQTAGIPYPATLTFDPPERITNWRPLVQWLLALPHLVVLHALGTAAGMVAFVSWGAIVFTGRLPEGLARFQSMYLRYATRVVAYAGFLREEYPAFSYDTTAADPGDDPRLRVDLVPELENRNRVTGLFRVILAIPHLVAMAVLGIAVCVLLVVGLFAVLFTGRWPEGVRSLLVGSGRWFLRANAYLTLLTDRYPPFSTA